MSAQLMFDQNLSFGEKALRIFVIQKKHNPVYARFCKTLGVSEVREVRDIPLLPIQAFKDSQVLTVQNNSQFNPQNSKLYFESSGTSGMHRSRHYISDPVIYKESILKGMNEFYTLDEMVIWAYTPGYNENSHSSLIYMLNTLIENDSSEMSRFLETGKPLNIEKLAEIADSGKHLMLFGAAFGLLDLIELKQTELPSNSIIMETGGMKTHRREMSKTELHRRLAEGFSIPENQIHSEYGMTELLSQAYSQGDEWFECVPWMQVSIRNPKNPMEEVPAGEEGLIGVIDLANIYSCSFLLTGDRGIQNETGKFQVLGRWNPRNLRGCNFLIDQD